jgi:hypothetical protein
VFKLKTNNPLSDTTIFINDEPGPGGANHNYKISFTGEKNNFHAYVFFQRGPVTENGHNGVTNESLLELVKHRLECFQAGNFACEENQVALDSINVALESLYNRTRDRLARNVEGKNLK